jgi:WD repeat-containing protein 23
MTSTAPDSGYAQIPINFADPSPRFRFVDSGIWSCRFSADGNEVIAGGNKKIFGNFLDILARLTDG